MQDFLPVNKKEMKERGWEQADFVYVIGDAYVDHPSFGAAIISRLLESRGYKVGIISQPDWRRKRVYRYSANPGWVLVTAEIGSMVNLHCVRRSTDRRIPIPREGRWDFVRTGLLLYTAT